MKSYVLALFTLIFWTACAKAPTPQVQDSPALPNVQSVQDSTTDTSTKPQCVSPDTLVSTLEIEITSPNQSGSLELQTFWTQSNGLRLDGRAFGMSIVAGLWQDTAWTMAYPQSDLVLIGHGPWVPLGPPNSSPWIDLSLLPQILWGDTSKIAMAYRSMQMGAPVPKWKLESTGKPCFAGCHLNCPKSITFWDGPKKLSIEILNQRYTGPIKSKVWQWKAPSDLRTLRLN